MSVRPRRTTIGMVSTHKAKAPPQTSRSPKRIHIYMRKHHRRRALYLVLYHFSSLSAPFSNALDVTVTSARAGVSSCAHVCGCVSCKPYVNVCVHTTKCTPTTTHLSTNVHPYLHQLPHRRLLHLKQPRGPRQILGRVELLHVVDERAGEGDGLAFLLNTVFCV